MGSTSMGSTTTESEQDRRTKRRRLGEEGEIKEESEIVLNRDSLEDRESARKSVGAGGADAPGTAAGKGNRWFRKPSIVWYRGHDLRIEDHPALLAAAQRGGPVVPLFIWEDEQPDIGDTKRWWLTRSLQELGKNLETLGVSLCLRKGDPADELRTFLEETGADAVFWNRAYEPYCLTRDEKLRHDLSRMGLTAESFKAELLIEPWELNDDETGQGFTELHSYMKAWMALPSPPQPLPSPSKLQAIGKAPDSMNLEEIGLAVPQATADRLSGIWTPGAANAKRLLHKFLHEVFPAYGDKKCRKDFDGTSRLSPHLRFGELSPRRLYHMARVRVSSWESDKSVNVLDSVSCESSVHIDYHSQRRGMRSTNEDAEGKGRVSARENKSSGSLNPEPSTPHPNHFNTGAASPQSSQESSAVKNGRERFASHHYRMHNNNEESTKPPIMQSARAFLKNMCLRDFSYHISFHYPDVTSKPLVSEFRKFPWAPESDSFHRWCTGTTGYPLVDAAMRQLRETGWIHNMMRFLLASFLTKYLLLPWQKGHDEFYRLLVDGDRSANALGWQWTSGCNTDSFPFKVLVNPSKLGRKMDPGGSYVRLWVPELRKLPTKWIHHPWRAPSDVLEEFGISIGSMYPTRVVEGTFARNRARDAMRVMRRIFTAAKPARSPAITLTVEDLIREWPDDSEEVSSGEAGASTDKLGLLPSLWSLAQYDIPPSNLTHTASCVQEVEQDLEPGNTNSPTTLSVPLATPLGIPGAPILSAGPNGTYPTYPLYFQQVAVNQHQQAAHNPIGVQASNLSLQNIQIPNTVLPTLQMAGGQMQNVPMPNMQTPNTQVPHVHVANIQVPNVPIPNVQIPNMHLVVTPTGHQQQIGNQVSQELNETDAIYSQNFGLGQLYGMPQGSMLPVVPQSQTQARPAAGSAPGSAPSPYNGFGVGFDGGFGGSVPTQLGRSGGTSGEFGNGTSDGTTAKVFRVACRPALASTNVSDVQTREQYCAQNKDMIAAAHLPQTQGNSGRSKFGRGTTSGNDLKRKLPEDAGLATVPVRRPNATGKSSGTGKPKSRRDYSRNSRSRPDKARTSKDDANKETTLEARRQILESVLGEENHVYYSFAKYLHATYDFTANTDRETSKDYVRLCNLKDDYHKRCTNEKDKLKIYKIKTFFSDILKLEVTGEWDRHNHGGVRGPYVYGIRASNRNCQSKDGNKSRKSSASAQNNRRSATVQRRSRRATAQAPS